MADTPDKFREDARKATVKAAQEGQTLLGQDMDFSTRYARFGWGKAAIGEVNSIFIQKTEQARKEFQMLQASQAGEKASLNSKVILDTQKVVMDRIRESFHLMMSISVVESPTGKKDDKVSTNLDLMALQEKGLTMMKAIDVRTLVYNTLPGPMKGAYLEMIGRNLEAMLPDYLDIIQKIDKALPLSEYDWNLLAGEILKNPEGDERTAAIVILATLKPKERFQLLMRTAKIAGAAEYGQLLVKLTRFTYITKDQAYALLDQAAVDNPANKAILEQAKATIGGAAVEQMQQAVIAHRKEGTRRVGKTSYGHKNRARGLLTFQGIAGMFLTVNGALTMGVNFAVDPLTFAGNPAFLLGLAEVTGGLEMTNGFEGVVPKPSELLALATKDRDEEKNDKAQVNLTDFRNELFNHPDHTLFYTNYVDRIVDAFDKKKKNTPVPDIKITLEDLGVKSKEDLPVQLQGLWEHRAALEADLSKWAGRFFRTSGDGIGRKTADGQLKWIQDERIEATGGKDIGRPFDLYEKPTPQSGEN